jgi:hypothetical protein
MKFNDIMKEVLDNNKRESFKEAVDTDAIKQILIKKTQKSSQEVDKMIKDYYDLAIRRGAKSETEIANEIRNFWLHTSSESFKEAIEKLVFVDNETAKDAEDILKKYPSATRVKCTRMQRTLLFDNVKDKETAKAQLIDNGINGLSKQSLSSESFKESYNASKLKAEYDRLLNSDMTTSDLQSALSVVVKSMFNYIDASYRDEIENILLQGLQAGKQFSSIKMSIESKVGNYGLVHGR